MAVDLRKIPSTPGVYKFFNKNEIIYIGKAKNLKKRVSSYFGKSYKDRKTSQIKFLTDKIETFTTKNEVEALLLEQTLIKENKPYKNVTEGIDWYMKHNTISHLPDEFILALVANEFGLSIEDAVEQMEKTINNESGTVDFS